MRKSKCFYKHNEKQTTITKQSETKVKRKVDLSFQSHFPRKVGKEETIEKTEQLTPDAVFTGLVWGTWGWRDSSVLIHLQRMGILSPAPTWRLTAICDSSSRGFNSLFCFL